MLRKKTILFIMTGVCLMPLLISASEPIPRETCPHNPIVAEILTEITQLSWTNWIRDLSGENTVLIDGQETIIKTRYSFAMFENAPNAQAYGYIKQELIDMGYQIGSTLSEHIYRPYGDYTPPWRNLVATLPGHGPHADEIVILTAHMDSTSEQQYDLAPGAEDNASGVATLLEAARILRHYQFDRTVKLIFFSGEEQGLKGSIAYVSDHAEQMAQIIGVINLDMFGYDGDEDRCFELHVGTLAASDLVGQCYVDSISHYNLNLSYDYLTTDASDRSDHAAFWGVQVGAIEVLENFHLDTQPDGCIGQDKNPHYHTTSDTLNQLFLPAALDIAKGGIATASGLALPQGSCFTDTPLLSVTPQSTAIDLTWTALENTSTLVYRALEGCDQEWDLIAETSGTSYSDTLITPGQTYAYKIETKAIPDLCLSFASSCQTVTIEAIDTFLPWINK